MQSKLKKSKRHPMSGIIRKAHTKYSGLPIQEYSQAAEETSELPTLADLVLPGTGHKFSDEFACLLRLLGDERKSA
jgi:hypothetical protein